MQTTAYRLLFSTITRYLSNSPNHLICEPSFALFSTYSNRPTRSFPQDLNFRDEIITKKPDQPDSNPSSPIPGRPLRGERRIEEPREDLFPDHKNNKNTFQQKLKPEWIMEKGEDRVGETLFQKLKLGALSNGKTEESDAKKSAAQIPEPESLPEDSDQLFKKMKETGLIPNAVAMLDGLCKDGLVQDALKLFGLMREKGTIPEVVIYTAVVEGFCKAAKFDDAKRIFRKMEKNEIAPNAFSYSVLIQGLCKGKKLEDAVDFCNEMLDAGKSPNGLTFCGLVDLCCKEKGVAEAEELVSSLRRRGYALDEKGIREHLDKKGPYSPMVWEAIFGKKSSQRPF